MNPAPEPNSSTTAQRGTPSVSAASSVGARSARRSRGGRRTLGVGTGVDLDSHSAASGGFGTAGREPTGR